VEIVGIASSPNVLWMNQIGRNLTDTMDGLLKGKRYGISFMIVTHCSQQSF